jgi:hypothetical protein
VRPPCPVVAKLVVVLRSFHDTGCNLTRVPSPAPRASRRAVLTGATVAGAGLLVSACGAVRSDETAGADDTDPTVPAVDADSDLVETVGDQITEALALSVATASSVRALRLLGQRLSALHRAHLRELNRPEDVEKGRVGGTAATARTLLLRSEERLQQQLVRAAVAAESGALAQVFASMAAAVAQERTVAS